MQKEAQGSYCSKKYFAWVRLQLRNKELQEELLVSAKTMNTTCCGTHKTDVEWIDCRTALCSSCSLLSKLPFAAFSASFSLLGTWMNREQTEDVCFLFPSSSSLCLQLNTLKCQCEALTLIWSFSERCRQTSLKSLRHMVTHEQCVWFVILQVLMSLWNLSLVTVFIFVKLNIEPVNTLINMYDCSTTKVIWFQYPLNNVYVNIYSSIRKARVLLPVI